MDQHVTNPRPVSFEITGRRVFVTGGCGFIGTHVVRALASKGAIVLAPSRRELDVRHAPAVSAWVALHQPHAIVHLAGVVGGRAWLEANGDVIDHDTHCMTEAIVQAASNVCVERVLGVGSTAAYADDAPRPFCESSLHGGAIPGTIGAYAKRKRELGMRLLNMPTASSAYVLPCNVYGPGQRTHGDRANVVGALVSRFTHAVQTDSEFVHCFGRGASREFVFVRDCADAIVDALQRIANASPINIGSGVATNIGTLTKCVAKHIGFSGRIDWSDDDGTVDALWSSDEHARQVLAWRPSTSLDAGLSETVDWYRNKEGAA